MSCNHPMKAFWTGNYTDNNKKEYCIVQAVDSDMVSMSYVEKKGFRVNIENTPYISKNGEIFLVNPISIPCGHCIGCKFDKSREWTTRICLEATRFQYAYFLTLTYDDFHLPFYAQLYKRDLVLFIKRLRKKFSFRYFACGEYGDDHNSIEGFGRPHYHIILLTDELLNFKPLHKANSFTCDYITDSWKFGIHEISYADENCIAYTAGYVYKKQLHNDEVHRVKPFTTCSDQPGFGLEYFCKHIESLTETKKVYVAGKTKPVFRYLWSKLSDIMDIEPIKNELMVYAGRSVDKVKWYFNNKYYEECGQKLDQLYNEYLITHRKEKL